jgi:hypothetical protein
MKKSSKTKGYRFIAFACGYAESCKTSTMVYGTPYFENKSFTTKADAITQLALELYAKFKLENKVFLNKCCLKASKRKDKFCSKCGKEIYNIREFDVYKFLEFVTNLHNSTCDSYGQAEYFDTLEPQFSPWSFLDFWETDKSETIYIAENAEYVLLAALLESKNNLIELEDSVEFVNCIQARDWHIFKEDKQPTYR